MTNEKIYSQCSFLWARRLPAGILQVLNFLLFFLCWPAALPRGEQLLVLEPAASPFYIELSIPKRHRQPQKRT